MLLANCRCATTMWIAAGFLTMLRIAIPEFSAGRVRGQESKTTDTKRKAEPSKLTPVMIQDFEKVPSPLTVWVVNIRDKNASVQVSSDHPHDGKKCLKLHYQFVGKGEFQYLGIPNKTRIQAPVHKLHFMLFGDDSKCSYGVQVSDASGETHQYCKNTGQGGVIDFKGWRKISIDLGSAHETGGGDNNAKHDYPITTIPLPVSQPAHKTKN